MTGMLLKDWYCLWDMLKRTVLLLGVLYPFLAIATNMPYLALMMPFLLAYYSLSSIAMDDKCQWFRYARTLPVPVQAQVGAKYLIVVTSSGIGLVWCLVTGGLHVLVKPHTVDWVGDYLLSGVVCCGTALLVMAVLYYVVPVRPTWFILSVCGALAHNVGQLLGAGVIISSSLSLYYAPVMLVLGLVMGALTSITLKALLPALGRLGFSTREKRGE